MKQAIKQRIKKLEMFRPVKVDPISSMSYEEKKTRIRELYSKGVNADHILTETEYEDSLLENYPEVLSMKTWPTPSKHTKDHTEMTSEERTAAIADYLRREAYDVAKKRGIV